ncbi:MAG: hypothetical protein ACU843_00770 [Gammaproteobacteria bacterium]
MNYFQIRIVRNISVTIVAVLIAGFLTEIIQISLHHESFFTGWLLLACLVTLTLFNARKKVPYLNLMRADTWLQFHIYLGFFSIAVFSLHIHFRLPNGAVEQLLAALYVLVAASGVVGIWLSRRLPSRLSRRGEQVLFERIPALRIRLRDEVEQLVIRAVEETGSTTLVDLYSKLLFPFLSSSKNFWFHIFESNRPYHQLREKIRVRYRYMNAREKEIMADIGHRVRIKDDLDYQYAGQALLKRWLFIHVPATYCLLIFMLFHLVVVYAFIGDI